MENDSFFCYPTKPNVITKLGFATEIIYEKSMNEVIEARARAKREKAIEREKKKNEDIS